MWGPGWRYRGQARLPRGSTWCVFSVPRALAAVHVQDLAGDESGVLQVDDCLGNITRFAHVPDRMQVAQCRVGFFTVHRRLDDPGAHRVHANAAFGVFDCQGFGRCAQAAFGQRGQHRRHTVNGVVHQAGGDVDDVPGALFEHFGDRQLGDVEEPVEVHAQHIFVVFVGVAGEGFGDEDTGVVDQAVDAAKVRHAFADYALGGGRVGDIAG